LERHSAPLANCCTPIEKERILTAISRKADETFSRNPRDHQPGTASTSATSWDNTCRAGCGAGSMQKTANMLEAIFLGMRSRIVKPVNYDSVGRIFQKEKESPILCHIMTVWEEGSF
jgi:hypothetical protein